MHGSLLATGASRLLPACSSSCGAKAVPAPRATTPTGSARLPGGLIEQGGCYAQSSSSSSSKGSGFTQLRLGPSTASEAGGTHSMLEAALLGSCSAGNTGPQLPTARLRPLSESPGVPNGDVDAVTMLSRTPPAFASDTQALPATQALGTACRNEMGRAAGLSTCQFLEEELCALHAAQSAERAAAGTVCGASAAGLTCEMLEAEIRSLYSHPPTPSRPSDVSGAAVGSTPSPRKHSAATRIQALARGQLARAAARQTDAEASPQKAAVKQEVKRLTQVLTTYEREVLPQLMVQSLVLKGELSKIRSEALEAAEASERDKEALRDRVAEAEAESQTLRSQLASVRLTSIGRRGGG